jgi:NDP-sugar pyrophosphorylase family protein
MHGLILAGGEGSRFAAAGVTTPKALVPVGGTPQILRLLRTFARLRCDSITCLLREGIPSTLIEAEAGSLRIPCRIHRCLTPSSLHTLVEGLGTVPPGPVFCSMVDTVMPWADWCRAYEAARAALGSGADAMLVVTPHVDDERPLHVRRDAAGRAAAIGDVPAEPLCVTGGVYAFGPSARTIADEALASGLERMRAFLSLLVRRGASVATVEVPRIIDLDDLRDLTAANAWQESCETDRPSVP